MLIGADNTDFICTIISNYGFPGFITRNTAHPKVSRIAI